MKDRKTQMATFTARAFERTHKISFPDSEAFLNFFKAAGCFLDDLCDYPVNDLPPGKREECLRANVFDLSGRIWDMDPPVIAIALKKIERHVREAIKLSGRSPDVFVLPFPGNHYQNEYVKKLSEIIREEFGGE